MKALVIFLAGLVIVFAVLAVVITATRSSERAFVVVDSSFPMREVWRKVPAALADIEEEGYAEYALATEKDLIHSWQDGLRFRTTTAFAPCDLSDLETYAEAAEADVRIYVTTAASCPTDGLTDWTIVNLSP